MAPAAPSVADRIIVGRHANAFTLDFIKDMGLERDFIDGLIICIVVQSNITPILRDPALQRAYATLGEPPPDDLRRPISISAVANSLGLPFETTRRRIAKLAARGRCVITPTGVVVPSARLTRPAYNRSAAAVYLHVRAMFQDLRRAGLLDQYANPGAGAASRPEDAWPVRAVVRLVTENVFRFLDPMQEKLGGLIPAFVAMELNNANTEHMPLRAVPQEGFSPEGLLLEEFRRPIPAPALARRLGIPAETTRRYLLQLSRDGWCEHREGGWIVPLTPLKSPAFQAFLAAQFSQAHRLFAALADLGILDEWEAERARP
jgi:DNA-binding Lrp family transcriptional regulator